LNSDGRRTGRRTLAALLLLACGTVGAQPAAPPTAPAAEQPGAKGLCSAQQPWPARFTFVYTVVASRSGLTLEGENELQFRSEGADYTLTSATRSTLYRARQDSRGTVQGRTLRPSEYTEHRQRREPTTTTIDWPSGTVRFTAAADAPGTTVPLLQDRLSMLLQLGERAQRQRDGDVVLPVAGVRNIASYRFERRGTERVSVPAGSFDTVRFERRDTKRDEALELWLAPASCWLPVKMRFTDDRGLTVENQLRSASFD
jgi:hypothetical protein